MAVYIASQTAALQSGIDATNRLREAAGRRMLDDATVEEVISAVRSRGLLPMKADAGSAHQLDTDAAG